jgi:hypothetical protein
MMKVVNGRDQIISLSNWRVTKTCLRLGSRIIGKCMMGSTSNALDKGGENFKKLYNASDVTKRNRNGQTKLWFILFVYPNGMELRGLY